MLTNQKSRPAKLTRKPQSHTLREAIREAHEEAGFSQSEVSRLAGLHQTQFNRYLNGLRDLSGEQISRLMSIYGVRLG